jgi:hypothetical protein
VQVSDLATITFEAHFENWCPQVDVALLGITRALGECVRTAGLKILVLPTNDLVASNIRRPIRWVLDNWSSFASDLVKTYLLDIDGPPISGLGSDGFQIRWQDREHYGLKGCSLQVHVKLDAIPNARMPALVKAIRQIMTDVAPAPECYAADWVVATASPNHFCSDPSGYHSTAELLRRDRAWGMARESRRHFVRRVAWFTLLTEHHLQRLGGRERLMAMPRDLSPRAWKKDPKYSDVSFISVGNRVVVENGRCDAFTLRMIREKPNGHGIVAQDPWWECLLLSRGLLLGSDLDALSREADETWLEYVARWKEPSQAGNASVVARPATATSEAYLRSNPPTFLRRRCLPGTFKDFPSSEFDNRIIWRIARPGESHAFEVWGSPTEYDLLFQSPVYIGAKQRDRAIVVADATRVGYDAELGHDKPTRRKPIRQLRCPRCWCEKFRLAVSLECDISREEAEDLGKRPEDLFTWLSLHAWCTNCKWHKTILDEECA